MTLETVRNAAFRLEDILADERAHLLSGRVREAAELSGEKLAALEAFETAIPAGEGRPPGGELAALISRIAQMAEENAIYLNAVRNGLRGLIGRLSGMNQDAYAGVYRQGGGQMSFPQATGAYRKWV